LHDSVFDNIATFVRRFCANAFVDNHEMGLRVTHGPTTVVLVTTGRGRCLPLRSAPFSAARHLDGRRRTHRGVAQGRAHGRVADQTQAVSIGSVRQVGRANDPDFTSPARLYFGMITKRAGASPAVNCPRSLLPDRRRRILSAQDNAIAPPSDEEASRVDAAPSASAEELTARVCSVEHNHTDEQSV
jgi:hypothetical protein